VTVTFLQSSKFEKKYNLGKAVSTSDGKFALYKISYMMYQK